MKTTSRDRDRRDKCSVFSLEGCSFYVSPLKKHKYLPHPIPRRKSITQRTLFHQFSPLSGVYIFNLSLHPGLYILPSSPGVPNYRGNQLYGMPIQLVGNDCLYYLHKSENSQGLPYNNTLSHSNMLF